MGKWNLDILYKGFDTEEYKNDLQKLEELIPSLASLANKKDSMKADEFLTEYVRTNEQISELVEKLAIYANLRYSANTRDTDAASMIGRIMQSLSETAAPTAQIEKAISEIADLESIIDNTPALSEFKYKLTKIQRDSRFLLSDKEETMLAKLNLSGASAWSDLQSSLTSGLKVKYNGEDITLSAVRNLAYSPDKEVRQKAFEAEIAAYDSIKDAVAFALNSIKLQVITECELRGYESPLAKALYQSRMQKETLDALLSAMEEYLPAFRKYLKAKSKALGNDGALPFSDIFAPMGKSEKVYSVDDAKSYLLNVFAKFDSELHDMVKCAFENEWIDFFPREGKVGGAFDCGVPSAKQSRVLPTLTARSAIS